MGAWLGSVLGWVLGGSGGLSSPSTESLKVALISTTEGLQWLTGFCEGWFRRQMKSATYWHGQADHFGGGMSAFTWDVTKSIERLVETPLAASFKVLEDKMHSWAVSYGLTHLPAIRNTANYAYNLVRKDDYWIRRWATPRINELMGFWSFYTKNDAPIVNQWKVWFKDPSLFALWAARPVTVAMTDYLNTNGGQGQLDKLTNEVIGDAVGRVNFVDHMAWLWLTSQAP